MRSKSGRQKKSQVVKTYKNGNDSKIILQNDVLAEMSFPFCGKRKIVHYKKNVLRKTVLRERSATEHSPVVRGPSSFVH